MGWGGWWCGSLKLKGGVEGACFSTIVVKNQNSVKMPFMLVFQHNKLLEPSSVTDGAL